MDNKKHLDTDVAADISHHSTRKSDNGSLSASDAALRIPHQPRNRVHVFRESRLAVDSEVETSVLLQDGMPLGKIMNISPYGLGVHLETLDQEIDVNFQLPKITVTLAGFKIFEDSAIVCQRGEVGDRTTLGLSLFGSGIDMEKVTSILKSQEIIEKVKSLSVASKLSAQVSPEFKILVADLNTLVQEIKFTLNSEEEHIRERKLTDQFKYKYEENVIDVALDNYRDHFHSLFSQFRALTSNLSNAEQTIHKQYFRANFAELIHNTPFISRAWNKPLGYAGDYGLMLMFYHYADIGNSLFDRFFHRFACNEPSALANKNRVVLLADHLMELYKDAVKQQRESFSVASIACGPAQEMKLFLEKLPKNLPIPVSIVLLDHEGAALKHVQSELRPMVQASPGVSMTLLQEDGVIGFIKSKPYTQIIEGFDAIISAGLFDYLSDRVAKSLILSFYERVRNGGQVIIGNVSKSNPDEFTMDYFMDWHIILRDHESLMSLIPEGSDGEVISESVGLNLFLKVTKK